MQQRPHNTATQTGHGAPWQGEPDRPGPPEEPAGPLVLVSQSAHGTRLSAVSPEAAAAGLRPDMKLADARAMHPALVAEPHDHGADATALDALARWMMRYSPSVALAPEGDGLLLDTYGCDHLFGGEAGMGRDITARLARLGYTVRLAFADTPGAALSVTGHGRDSSAILPPGHGRTAPDLLDDLPVAALRLDGDTLLLLKRLGLKRIGDMRRIDRSALARRFRDGGKRADQRRAGPVLRAVQLRLDQLAGAIAEPLSFIAAPAALRVQQQCPDLALETGAVELAFDALLPVLCSALEERGLGLRHLRLTAYRADGGCSGADVRLSRPGRDVATIRRLMSPKFERIDCGHGVDLFTLAALAAEPLQALQDAIIENKRQPANDDRALAGFADIITNRFSSGVVHALAPRASHVPERAQKRVAAPAHAAWRDWQAVAPAKPPRPLRLLARPEPVEVIAELPDSPPAQFTWRRVRRRVVRATGPERILPEWWKDHAGSGAGRRPAAWRDYYHVEDGDGMRYWLFKAVRHDPLETDGQDEPSGWVATVSWFMHGLF